jgi:hypothetical protein
MPQGDFDEWAAQQRRFTQPPAAPEQVPDMPTVDPLEKWKRDADLHARRSAYAKAELRKQTAALAQADNNNGGVDWAAILQAIADGFDGIRKRIEALEAALQETDTEVLLDLPLHLQPRHGPGAGVALEAGVRFSPPLLTKGAKSKAANTTRRRIVQLSESVEKRLAQLDHTLAEQTKMQREIEELRTRLQQSEQATRDRLADLKSDINALRLVKPAPPADPPMVTHYHTHEK